MNRYAARNARATTTIHWEPSGGGTGWRGTGRTGQTYLLRRAGGRSWRLWIAGVAHGPFPSLEAAKGDAERRERHAVNEPVREDRAPRGDTLFVFFHAAAASAYQRADGIAEVVERALDSTEGRWRLEPLDRGWVMRYGPFDRSAFRTVEGALTRRFGNAVRASVATLREHPPGPPLHVMAKKKHVDPTAWRDAPEGVAKYRHARAEAQARANATGMDHGIEANDLFHEWSVRMLPAKSFRSGHELRVEVVHPENPSKTLPGHGPNAREATASQSPVWSPSFGHPRRRIR